MATPELNIKVEPATDAAVNECAELLERMQTNYNDTKTTDIDVVNKISADEEEVEEECVEVEEIEYKGRSYLLSDDNNVYNDSHDWVGTWKDGAIVFA